MPVLNISDLSLCFEAEKEIDRDYEKARRVQIPKGGQFFELPSTGDERLVPSCSQWVLSIDDVALKVKPEDFPAKGWMLLSSFLFLYGAAFVSVLAIRLYRSNPEDYLLGVSILGFALFIFLLISVVSFTWLVRQPLSRPVLLNRRTGRVAQVQSRNKIVESSWSDLRPFVELIYTAQAMPIWRLHLVQTDDQNKVVKSFLLKILVPGAGGAACYFEYLRRYMSGRWAGLPDTTIVHGMRRSLLRQFRNDFGWMFGKRHSWSERPAWLKALMFLLMPLLTFAIWPFGFFILLGSRFGWMPHFSSEIDTQAEGGSVPAELVARLHDEPALALAERLLYGGIIFFATAVWAWLGFDYVINFFGAIWDGN